MEERKENGKKDNEPTDSTAGMVSSFSRRERSAMVLFWAR